MLDKIKHLAKHSFVYSISNVALKASGIILLPIYTKYFTLEEYGRLGLLLITIIIFSQSLVLGQGLSIIRFNNTVGYEGKRKSVFFTITFFILVVIGIFLILTEIFLTDIASLFGDPKIYERYLNICIYIVAVITLNNLFLSKLRADDRSITYTLSGIVKLFVMIALSVYFIVYQGSGIEGVLYAQLAGELSNSVFVLPLMFKEINPVFDKTIIKESLRYGFPLIFSSMAINLLNGSDRYIIKYLLNDAQLGLYELAYKVAGVHNMFLILPFNLTLFPLAFKLFKKENDKRYYSKIKTYFAFILVWAGLALCVFSEEIIMLFAQSDSYYPAYSVVPWIVLAYILYGVSLVSSLGMYLTGNNHYVAYITLFCAGLNIALNFWLIPYYGIMGAAVNTLIAFFILDLLSNLASNKYYRIKFENYKLFKVFFIGTALYLISVYFNDSTFFLKYFGKFLLIIFFPFILFYWKFFEDKELSALQGAVTKWKNPLKWIGYFRNEVSELTKKIEND